MQTITSITSGKFSKVFDAGAASFAAAMQILTQSSKGAGKGFASTDDWSPMSAPEGSDIEIYRVELGQIGRYDEGEEQKKTCADIEGLIPPMEELLAAGRIKPMEWEVIGTGLDDVASAVKTFDSGKVGAKKGLVKLA